MIRCLLTLCCLLLLPLDASAGPRTQEARDKARAGKRLAAERRDAIDWESTERRKRVNLGDLSAENRQRISQSTVPVLLPRVPALLRNAVLFVGDGWYTATMKGPEHHVFVRGTRVSRPAQWNERERRAIMDVKDSLRVTRIEGIVSMSFSVHGAAYNVEIECRRGQRDRLCANDGPVEQLFKGLALAGGARDMGGPGGRR
ncbi:MAG: hypothetical protein KTR31_22320 [Myxococcales bacterium]|nr:hypothetical protein [Myxococcales bacterium]